MFTLLEYIWIDADYKLRSKTKVEYSKINTVSDIVDWNYDGSSTNQATGDNSEIILKPCAIFPDPFRKDHHLLVLCSTYNPDGTPTKTNHREWAKKIFDSSLDEEPWFGLEQEYFFINPLTNLPLSYPNNNYILEKGQGDYYCRGSNLNNKERLIAEEHLQMCLYSNIKIAGLNAEVAPSQYEFQIGPCVGIEQGDHLWVGRYILNRIASMHNVKIEYEPKPLKGHWNGSGCHANYSTKLMREENGLEHIMVAIEKLGIKHSEHMKVYGDGNLERMTGRNETASYDKFTYGVASRNVSVRIGTETYKNKKGYFEDRRPSSNCDPYLVSAKIFETTMSL